MKINISVALTVYNGERYLAKQLQSIKDQVLQPIEIVIVDDVSSDNSEELIRNFDFGPIACRYYKNETNLGPVANFKKAIGLCSGSFIALCDQDDIWLPHKIKRLYEANLLKDQLKPVVSYSDASLIESDDTFTAKSVYKDVWKIKPANYGLKMLLVDNVIIGCSSLINSKMKDEVMKMPVQGVMMHDHWIALIANSFGETAFVNESLLLYRSHTGSVTEKIPLRGIISKIKTELQSKSNYLNNNIVQAKEFKNTYKSDISLADLKILNKFISLEKQPFAVKRLYTKLLKMYSNR